MTPERRQELRRWSAELQGWKFGQDAWLDKNGLLMYYKENWTPDLPSAPASQILSVIERMRELGWAMQAWMMADDFRVVFYKTFKDWRELRQRDYTQADTLQGVILEAAHAAWLAGGGEKKL